MTRNQIASALALAEDGKSVSSIGDVREILRLLVYLDAQQVHDGGAGALTDLQRESDLIVQAMITEPDIDKAAKKAKKKKKPAVKAKKKKPAKK